MPLARRCFPFAAVAAVSVWLAFANTFTGDYGKDAGPVVRALTEGDISRFLSDHRLVGPFAILLQAPFAALGNGSRVSNYQWACIPCLLAVGLLGIYLAAAARRRGVSRVSGFVIATLCLVNPLTFYALQTGHPEELLTAALCVAAVAVAARGQAWRAAILLGLALVSKQWAVIAVLPVLMALPALRLRVALGAAAVALAFTLPGVIADPGAFSKLQGTVTFMKSEIQPMSIWFPTADTTQNVTIGSTHLTAHVREAPPVVGRYSHPLVILVALGLPLALALRRRRFSLSGTDAMALLALLALLRCALDPVDVLYYHEPLLLALIGWDALAARDLPWRGLAATLAAALFWLWSNHVADPSALNLAYIAVAAGSAIAIAAFLFRRAGSPRKADSFGGTLLDIRTAALPW